MGPHAKNHDFWGLFFFAEIWIFYYFFGILAEIARGPERLHRPIIWYHFQLEIPTSNHVGAPFSSVFGKIFFGKS